MSRSEIVKQIADMHGTHEEPQEPVEGGGPPKPPLHAPTLYWASHYVQEWAERTPRIVFSAAAFAGMERAAIALGAAAERVARGEDPRPLSSVMSGEAPGSPPEASTDGVLPIMADAMITQLRRVSAKATPGEWELESGDGVDIRWVATPSPLQSALLTPEERALKTEPIGTTTFSPVDEVYAALSVNAVPVLIAEIERLRKLVK